MSPTPTPFPTPPVPNGAIVSLVFLLVLFTVVSVLWWQVRRTRREGPDLEGGPWPSEDPPDAR